ncbi:MAG: EF-hand domain-containing protein [Verrucomicrobiales bacterium]|nr:EF-hand domain-containing protein [Verrucomicrobiales bacterium]
MKKILILATVIVSGMALGLAQAEEGDKGGKGKGKGGDPAARADAMLKKLDTDGSGGISLEEFAAAPKPEKAKGKEGMLDKMFAARDTNSDGELDKAELSAPRKGGKGKGKGKGKGGKGAEDAE